jgi:hypothetical protein
MNINYLADVPFALGILALLLGIFTNGFEIRLKGYSDCPQWFCRPMLLILGILLIGFSFVGYLAPQ